MPTEYEVVIGLEVHAQILTRTKLFCACSAQFGAEPNTHVCPVCLGLPGALPVPNAQAIALALRTALALGCSPQPTHQFARKCYFYPDLPKGYQTSQLDRPLALGGAVPLLPLGPGTAEDAPRSIALTRIHLEEDAAKNLHGVGPGGGTVVDFNRGGVPLMEIVSEPDLRSPEEAERYLRSLREILIFLGVNDGNLEEGSFRCDANVSLRPRGQSELGTRVELKNINSFRFVRRALEHEVVRQEALLAAGESIVQETRGWNENKNQTLPMRGKEEAQDYRYFPDPDLPPLVVTDAAIDAARASLPELPAALRARWQASLKLSADQAQVLSVHPELARYLEAVILAGADPRAAANFIQGELMRHLRFEGLQAEIPVPATRLAELLALVQDGTLSGKLAKEVFAEMLASGKGAGAIVKARGLEQLSDQGEIETLIAELIAAHPNQVQAYRGGKTQLLGFFVGQVMKQTRGRANPQLVNDLLRGMLAS